MLIDPLINEFINVYARLFKEKPFLVLFVTAIYASALFTFIYVSGYEKRTTKIKKESMNLSPPKTPKKQPKT